MIIAGIDEAGRGPLAGPVVAVCVVFKQNYDLQGLNDSKKISKALRTRLFKSIHDQAEEIGIGIVDSSYIDQYNILQATFKAMKDAVLKLKRCPDLLLVDGNKTIPGFQVKQIAVVKGDSLVASIAAASIIAKVTRDRIMEEYDRQYPIYGFSQHKGYGTKGHFDSILQYGPSPIHRRSFFPVKAIIGAGETVVFQKAGV